MAIRGAIMVPHPPLIIPEVGGGQEKQIQATVDAYHKAARQAAAWKPETVVVLSPHSAMYADYFHISPGKRAEGDFGAFRAPQVKISVNYDTGFVKALCQEAQARDIPAGTLGERDRRLDHGTMIPLWFLNHYMQDYQVVRIGLSGLPLSVHYQLGQCILKTAQLLDRRVAVIGSGDLSHRLKAEGPYGFAKEGPQYDERIMEAMGSACFDRLFDFLEEFCEKAAECGHRSFVVLAGTLDLQAVKAQRLSHEGTFGVGYGVCTYETKGSDPKRNFLQQYEEKTKAQVRACREKEDAYVCLARQAVETYVRSGKRTLLPEDLPQEMTAGRAGVFVSIKEEGRLRGCIGTISPVQDCIAREIVENGISAASRDPRFDSIQPEELDKLIYSVDVLGETEKIDSADQLDVKRYGVVVKKGEKRGLLLPNLEGVDTPEQQIAIAKKKAGIPLWEQQVRMERFEVVRHF